MIQMFDWFVLSFFVLATSALATYGIHLYVLLWLFRRRSRDTRSDQKRIIAEFCSGTDDAEWPVVTSQIPLYNEVDVADRIICAVAALDYPAGKHEIQVLDDSDDSSRAVVDEVVSRLRSTGVDIHIVRRAERTGYKAGALAVGVAKARGEFLSVFDADFVPPGDFLRRAVPLLVHSPDLACLQGRWSHINQDESWLTRSQALGIDGHFAVEQGARAWNGLMMNFNGTAGVWRKAAIEDPEVGGWNGDTLTEDLDLSYRAQLSGWRIDYCFDLACPAELPGDINAFKSQQRRWATGSIQVACKLLPRIWRTPMSLGRKVEATLHLTHYSVSLWMLVLAIVARPMLILTTEGLHLSRWFWVLWGVIIVSAVAPAAVYSYARWSLGGRWSGIWMIPQMLALGCGMCVNNTWAVVRGLFLHGGEFVRTPKSGSREKKSVRSSYASAHTHLWLVELALSVYSFASFAFYVRMSRWPVSVFLLLYGLGFLVVGLMSAPFSLRRSGGGEVSSSSAVPSPACVADSSQP
jgi:cellulose synthase/poly-beta-1,6-N-acetylglucosamine synthase-like glycosyltransferase